ncbi:MAG: immunoglobulin domain-containing protein [Phycisphaeraceae bacterium]|nr:immunoglobulin domain-containing protein [Phycisphaeraceae bacterium]
MYRNNAIAWGRLLSGFVTSMAGLSCRAIMLALALGCGVFSVECGAQTLTWTGAGDGVTFGMATNWSPNAIPGAGNDCVVPAGAPTIQINNNFAVKSLTTGRAMSLGSCCTFTLTGGLQLQSGAVFQLANSGSCSGLIFSGGTQSIWGTGEISVVTMGINGSGILLVNNASVTIASGVRVSYSAAATGTSASIEVPSGCTLTNQGEIALSKSNATLSIWNGGSFSNQGTLSVSAGTLKLTTGVWTNSGTLSLTGSGTLSLAGQFSSLGQISRSGGTLIVGGQFTGPELAATAATGEIILTAADFTGVTLRGNGAVVRGSGNSSLRNCAILGEVKLTFGAWTIRDGLEVRGSSSLALSGSPTLRFSGGSQNVWGTGTISNPSFSVDPSTSVTVSPSVSMTFGAGGANPVRGDGGFFVDSTGTLTTLGAITLLGPYSTFSVTGTGVYTNAGSITAGDTNSVRLQSENWVNSGTITGNGAFLTFAGRFSALGSVTRTGGTLTVGGTFVGAELRANNGTGNISLADLSAAGVLFSADGNNTMSIEGAVALSACTLAANTTYKYCGALTVQSGLTLSGGATLTIPSSSSCSKPPISFDGGTQLVSGQGTIQGHGGNDSDILIKNNATVTIGPDVVLRVQTITIESGSQLTNNGTIASDATGMQVSIGGAGAFTNNSLVVASGGSMTLSVASWTNSGIFSVSGGSLFSLQGTYSSLGTIQRTGGTIELKGTFTGSALAATPATGDLQLANLTLTGVALSSSGGAKLRQKYGSGVLDACSIAGEMVIGQSGQCVVRNGLTFIGGATITIDSDVASYSASLVLSGGPQTIAGTGTIQFASTAGSANFNLSSNAIATIESGIVVRNKAGSTGSKIGTIVLFDSSVCTMRGQVISDVPGRSLVLTGYFGSSLVNEGMLGADGASLEVSPPLWTNSGFLLLQNSGILTLGGSYSTIGAVTRSGGTLILNGTPSNLQLSTDDAGGDIVLGTPTLINSTLRGLGTARVIARGNLTLDACTLGGTFVSESCSTVNINNGLMLDNAAISFVSASNCSQSNLHLYFWGGPQTFGGTGTVQLGGGKISTVDVVTFAPGISFSIGAPGRTSSGSIGVNGTLNCYSPIVMNSNASLDINGGTGSRFVNLGGIDLLSGTMNIKCLWGSTGSFSFAPTARLFLDGTYTVDSPFSVSSGGLLSLSGNWVNNSTISSNGAELYFYGTWSNAGLFDVSNSTWRIGNQYPSLGAHTGSNNTVTYAGSLPFGLLVADATTGDITLSALSATGTTFRALDGAKFINSASGTWTGCTLDGDMLITGCTGLSVVGGLTLQNGSTISIDLSCNATGLKLTASSPTQAGLLGNGRVRILNSSTTGKGISFEGTNQDIPSGITIEMPAEATSAATSVAITSGLTVTNRGKISMDRAGGTFAWTGGNLVNLGLLSITAGKLDIAALSGSIGNIQLEPGSSLSLGGSYTVDHPLAVSSGGTLSLSGTWTNSAAISSSGATLILGGTWTNSGSFAVSNSAWTIGGTYTSLGNWSGANNALTYGGTFPGTSLIANASTGDITLATVTFKNAALTATAGAKFVFAQNATVTLNNCDLGADLLVGPCAALVVTGPLNLLNNPTIRLANGGCNLTPLTFSTTNSTISGAGQILFGINTLATVISVSTASATFGPDVFVGFDPTQPSTKSTTISISSARTLTLQGILSADQVNRTLNVSGSGTFTNSGSVRSTAGTLSIAPTTISNLPTSTSVLTGGKWIANGGSLTLGSRTVVSIAPATELRLTGPAPAIPNLSGLRSNSGTFSIESLSVATTPSTGTFSNTGTLELGPNALLSVTGSASLLPGSTISARLRGIGPTEKGSLVASGPIVLGGRLTGSFESPYVPTAGDVIAGLVVAPTISGSLDSVCFADNPSRLGALASLISNATPMSLDLIVTPDAGLSPVVTQQPSDTSATPVAHFEVDASPDGGEYRWMKNSVPLNDGVTESGSVISGSSSLNLAISGVTPADAGSYRCSITNICGTVASDAAYLIFCAGDLNADGLVEDADFVIFLAQYNILDCADPGMRPGCSADLNKDGVVDDADFQLFVPAYNELICD